MFPVKLDTLYIYSFRLVKFSRNQKHEKNPENAISVKFKTYSKFNYRSRPAKSL